MHACWNIADVPTRRMAVWKSGYHTVAPATKYCMWSSFRKDSMEHLPSQFCLHVGAKRCIAIVLYISGQALLVPALLASSSSGNSWNKK